MKIFWNYFSRTTVLLFVCIIAANISLIANHPTATLPVSGSNYFLPYSFPITNNHDRVQFNESPNTSVTILGSTSFCAGGSTSLVAHIAGPGPFTYLWSTGATTPFITINTPGTYTVTGTDGL